MGRKIAPAIADILTAINAIERATQDKTYRDFTRDWLLRHGVQRGIEIISEAARQLPDSILRGYPDVPWKQVKGIGNILRHEYHKVADDIIWNVIRYDLPTLKKAIKALRAKYKND